MSKYIASIVDDVEILGDATYTANKAVFINVLLSVKNAIAKDTKILAINIPRMGEHAMLRLFTTTDTVITDDDTTVTNSSTSLSVNSSATSISPNPHTHTATVTENPNTAYVTSTRSTVDGLIVNTISMNEQLSAGTVAIMGWVNVD